MFLNRIDQELYQEVRNLDAKGLFRHYMFAKTIGTKKEWNTIVKVMKQHNWDENYLNTIAKEHKLFPYDEESGEKMKTQFLCEGNVVNVLEQEKGVCLQVSFQDETVYYPLSEIKALIQDALGTWNQEKKTFESTVQRNIEGTIFTLELESYQSGYETTFYVRLVTDFTEECLDQVSYEVHNKSFGEKEEDGLLQTLFNEEMQAFANLFQIHFG